MTSSLLSHLSRPRPSFMCHRFNTSGDRQATASVCAPGPQCSTQGSPWRPEAVIARLSPGPFGGPGAAGRECAGAVRRGLGLAGAGGCQACARAFSVGCRARSGPLASRAPSGRSEWANAQLGAGVVTRGRGRPQRASRGAL